MFKRLRDDSGVAMITGLLAMMVVASLAVVGTALATHNLDASAGDRRRMQAIHAAEAGLDAYLRYLSVAPIVSPSCAPPETQAQQVPTTPASSFTATARYYASATDPTDLGCPPSGTPGAVTITSVGTSNGVSRTMQALYRLTKIQKSQTLYSGIVYSDGDIAFTAQANLLPPSGSPYGADVYANGNITISAGAIMYGGVYAQGTINMSGGPEVKRDAISKLALTTGGSSIIRGNARSSTQNMSLSNNTTVYGNAYYCTGAAPGGNVQGQKIQNCDPSLPDPQPWTGSATYTPKQFTYTQSDWQTAGYSIQSYSGSGTTPCDQAKSFIAGISSGDWVVRISAACTLTYTNSDTVDMKGNLLVVSDGGLSVGGHAGFTSSSKRNLFLAFNYLTARPCSAVGIDFNTQSYIAANVNTLLYTPCKVSFGSQSSMSSGQIIAGGGVTYGAGSNITTVPMLIPGTSQNGFQQDMKYRREVVG